MRPAQSRIPSIPPLCLLPPSFLAPCLDKPSNSRHFTSSSSSSQAGHARSRSGSRLQPEAASSSSSKGWDKVHALWDTPLYSRDSLRTVNPSSPTASTLYHHHVHTEWGPVPTEALEPNSKLGGPRPMYRKTLVVKKTKPPRPKKGHWVKEYHVVRSGLKLVEPHLFAKTIEDQLVEERNAEAATSVSKHRHTPKPATRAAEEIPQSPAANPIQLQPPAAAILDSRTVQSDLSPPPATAISEPETVDSDRRSPPHLDRYYAAVAQPPVAVSSLPGSPCQTGSATTTGSHSFICRDRGNKPSLHMPPTSRLVVDSTPQRIGLTQADFVPGFDVDVVWSRFLEFGVDRNPSVIPLIFKAQSQHPDRDTRRDRLIHLTLTVSHLSATVALSLSPVGSQWWLSFDQLKSVFVMALEMGEELSMADGQTSIRRSNAGKRRDIAVMLREPWRMLVSLGENGWGETASTSGWEERDGLLWRWVGLVATEWSEPSSGGAQYLRPENSSDRVDDLAFFLDTVAVVAPAHLQDFSASLMSGWRGQTAIAEVEEAVTHVLDINRQREQMLDADQKTYVGREAKRRLIAWLRGKVSSDGLDPETVGRWVEALLKSDLAVSASESLSESEAASLLSRTTTSVLLLMRLSDNSHPLPPTAVALVVEAADRLRFYPPHLRVSLKALRRFATVLLRSYSKLDVLSAQHHYALILLFLQAEDLSYTRRLHETFRARARQVPIPVPILESMLRLSLGLRTLSCDEHQLSGQKLSSAGFSASLYTAIIAEGGAPLHGEVLTLFLSVVGAAPRQTGLATRAIADSVKAYGKEIVDEQLAVSIAQATCDRALRSISQAVNSKVPLDWTKLPSAVDALSVLPLLRGFPTEPALPSIEAFNAILSFIADRPTPESFKAVTAELVNMLNHGPTPTTETFNILIRMHLGIRVGPQAVLDILDSLGPPSPKEPDMVRAVTMYHLCVARQRLQPDRFTFSYLLEGLCRLGKAEAAMGCFREAVDLELVPMRESTESFIRLLLWYDRRQDAEDVVQAWEILTQEDASMMIKEAEYSLALKDPNEYENDHLNSGPSAADDDGNASSVECFAFAREQEHTEHGREEPIYNDIGKVSSLGGRQ